jgi:hypothetical protein
MQSNKSAQRQLPLRPAAVVPPRSNPGVLPRPCVPGFHPSRPMPLSEGHGHGR